MRTVHNLISGIITALILSFSVFISVHGAIAAPPEPPVVLLWPEGAPGALGDADTDKPRLTVYLPQKSVGTGVVVFPGGGYGMLAKDHEGLQIARWLNGYGVAAFVVEYRLGPRYHHPTELVDAQRAIQIVRFRAKEFGIQPDRIGVWGFSAGGHLAATTATHFAVAMACSLPGPQCESPRPDFAILTYPVISMKDPYVHKGSRKNLLGDNPDPALIELLSNELQVTPQTPPTFLVHTTTDSVVPAENSINFYLALRKAGVPAEMHIYEEGPHGFGLAPNDPVLSGWPKLLADWMRGRGLLDKK